MAFVGTKTEIFDGELTATSFYPSLKFSDFQLIYGFLATESKQAIELQMTIDRQTIHSQLQSIQKYESLEAFSVSEFEDPATAGALYTQAVFALTAANLIGKQLATDTTKSGAERQAALTEKIGHLQTLSRQAIDALKSSDSGYTMELI